MRDENGLVWRNGVADAPCGDIGHLPRSPFPLTRSPLPREPCRRETSANERLHKRVGRKTVRAVKTGASALPYRGKTGNGSLARSRRLDAAARVVRSRDDRNQVLSHVDAELHALLVDVREARHQVGPALLPDVEVHAVVAGALHLAVNRARDDVARREAPARIVLLHELAAMLVHENGTFAANGLGNEETLRLRMVEASRMELDELHVLDLRAGAPRERYAVASRRVGIAGVEIDLATAASRKHSIRRANRVYLASLLVEDVCANAAVGAFEPDALRHHEVDHYRLLPDVDGRAADAAYHRRLALLACDVACVEDAPRAVPALAGKLP